MSKHYSEGYDERIQVMDILKDKLTPQQFIGFCLGNIIKYTLRANFKNDFNRDLSKATHYGEILDDFLRNQDATTQPND